ncbi:MAG: hypothetical protein ACTHU1_11165 [Arachnia sp.]
MMVTDLQHFLDLPPDVPGPARRLADQLGNIVRAATAGDAGSTWESALPCHRMPGHRRCTGRMLIRRDFDVEAPIRWECSVCPDGGSISNWAGSPFDLRPKRLTRVDPVHEVAVSLEVAAVLRDLQLLDPDSERLIFRIRPRDTGAILTATDDGLEDLIEAVAAEANHEVNRRRQQRLDAAFEALSDAAYGEGGW